MLMGGVVAAAILTSTVYAQSAGSSDTLEEIIVTGTSIKRVAAEGSLPVQTFDQQDISRSGATSVTDFIQQLPVMQGFTHISQSVGGGGGGITSASLHDLGEQYTLVLLNGHRVAPAGSGTTIDLNSIPLAAVDRIEVLTDGASAIYGADAIAGVVNFILKQGESPLELNMHFGRPQHDGALEANFSLSKGFGNLQSDGYAAFFAVSYDKKNALQAKQRDFASTGIIAGRQGTLNYDFFNGSPVSVPAGVEAYFNNLDPYYFNPYLLSTGSCSSSRAAHVRVGDECWIDYTSTIEISPQVERKAVYGSGKLSLGNSGWNLFGDLAYVDVGTLIRVAPYPGYFGLSTSSPLYSTYVEPYLTSTELADLDSVWVDYRLFDLGNRTEKFTTKSLHVVGGAEGKVGDWTMSVAATVSSQTQHDDYLEGWPLADKFYNLMDSGTFDPFSDAPLAAAQLQALKSTQYIGNFIKTKIGMRSVEANAQNELFTLPGGAFIASFGGDWRKTGYKEMPSSAAANAEILFDENSPAYDLSRSSLGAYTEVLAPLTSALELTAAVRHDRISGVDDDTNGVRFGGTESATTFKVGGKWLPIRILAVRGSYGTGFRTASMIEIAQPTVDFGVTGGNYNCPFNAGYDPLGYVAAGYVCTDGIQFEVFQGGNARLRPEKSKQWNVGLIFEPAAGFSAGVNYWSVEIKDAVQRVSERLILTDPAKYLELYSVKQKSGQNFVAIVQSSVNIGRKQVKGIDWDLAYSRQLGLVTFTGKLASTHLLESRYTVPGTDDQWTSSLNAYGVDDQVAFRDVLHASAIFAYGGWEHLIQGNYRNGYTDVAYTVDDCVFYTDTGDCSAGALQVPSYATFDWRSSLTFESTTVSLGVKNMFDKKPPRSLQQTAGHQLGYDPRYTDAELRTFVVSASIRF